MNGSSLLERLRNPGAGSAHAADPGDVKAAVLRHLRRLLNTRQGMAPAMLEYGVPDFMDALRHLPESASEMERAIKASIERFEPRLHDVEVEYAPEERDVLTLGFVVRARLVTTNEEIGVSFLTRINPDGPVDVKD